MAKTRIEGKRVSGRKTPTGAKKPNQRRATKGVAKTTRPKGKPRQFQLGEEIEEIEVLTEEHTQAIPEAKKTNDEQEDNLVVSDEASTSISNEAGANRFLPINNLRSSPNIEGVTKSTRKSERVDVALGPLSTGSNPATVITVPRPRARFAAKGQSQNLGIVMADLGNYTTTASRVLGLGELEDIDFWNGAAAARSTQIRTRVVARNGGDGKWDLEFGPDTDVVCEKEGEVVVFDNMKLAMNPASEHYKVQREKEKKVGLKGIYRKFIQWLFRTIFDASKTANPDIEYFRVYTGLPAEWPENVSYQYQTIIEKVSGWEGKVDVHIISEATAAINGRLKSLLVEQRRGLGVYLEDNEHGGVLDIGDATGVCDISRDLYQQLIEVEYNHNIFGKIPAYRQRYRISRLRQS
jgi:hypothetical protein